MDSKLIKILAGIILAVGAAFQARETRTRDGGWEALMWMLEGNANQKDFAVALPMLAMAVAAVGMFIWVWLDSRREATKSRREDSPEG